MVLITLTKESNYRSDERGGEQRLQKIVRARNGHQGQEYPPDCPQTLKPHPWREGPVKTKAWTAVTYVYLLTGSGTIRLAYPYWTWTNSLTFY